MARHQQGPSGRLRAECCRYGAARETINRKGVSQDWEIENGNFGMSVSIAPLTPRDPRLRPGEVRRHRPHSKTLTVAVSEWRSPPS